MQKTKSDREDNVRGRRNTRGGGTLVVMIFAKMGVSVTILAVEATVGRQ